jgi:hypothetical protein
MLTKSDKSKTKEYGKNKLKDNPPDEKTNSVVQKTKQEDALIRINKKYLNPFVPLWLAILFFGIDLLAFQKPLSVFISWILIVVPLLLLALSFFFFALRKQFLYLSFPFQPIFMSNITSEGNNVFRAVLMCLLFIFMALMVTILFLRK